MKKYQQPDILIMEIVTMHIIAASGDVKTSVHISNDELEDVTFNSRENGFSLWDDEE